MRPSRTFSVVCAVVVLTLAVPVLAQSSGRFVDDDGSIFEADIEAIAAAGITLGCNPPANDRFCPNDEVTRAQMAAFLVRGLGAAPAPFTDRFVDDDGSIFETDIETLAALGITQGCASVPPLPDGSTDPVSTPQPDGPGAQLTDVRVANFDGYDRVVWEFEDELPGYLVEYVELPVIEDPTGLPVALEGDRALLVVLRLASAFDQDFNPTYTGPDRFTVRLGSVQEVVEAGDFERVMSWAIGVHGTPAFRVTTLVDPARLVIDVDRPEIFCPNDPVTRGQMAAFLTRSFGYVDDDPAADRFVDDDTSIFEADIEALAAAAVTLGCNPPDNDRYCPADRVTRGQMAAFLARALGLEAPAAACTVEAVEPVIVETLDPTGAIPGQVDLAECQNGYARAFYIPDEMGFETEQLFLEDVNGHWEILTFGTGIDCGTDTDFQPPELETACEALGLR